MNNNALIGIILIFMIYLYSQNNNNVNNVPTVFNSPCDKENGPYYDKSQFLYKSLHKYFNHLTRGEKRFLRGKCDKNIFTRPTIDEILKIELDEITGKVLDTVNQNPFFNFSLLQYENVIVMSDNMKNRRYIIDFLVNDRITHYGLRLKMDIVKFVIQNNSTGERTGEKTGNTSDSGDSNCTTLTSPAFRRYYGGYPTIEQMIPLPTHVIPTANLVLSDYGKETIVPIQSRYIHLNSIVIENSTHTLDIANRCNTTCNTDGIQDTSLPYGFETRRNDGENRGPYLQHSKMRNKWPKLDDEPPEDYISPCSFRDGMCWDDKGIPVKKRDFNWNNKMTLPKEDCLGKLSSTVKYPRRPNYFTSNYQIPQNSGESAWLFDRTRGDFAMPGKK